MLDTHMRLAHDFRPMAPLWLCRVQRTSPSLNRCFHSSPNIDLTAMYASAQVQLTPSFPVSARSSLGQQGSKPVSKSTFPSQLARRATPVGSTSPGRIRRHTTTASAAPVGDIALLPSLFPVVLRAFSAGLLLYSSLRWASARSDRQQVSACVM